MKRRGSRDKTKEFTILLQLPTPTGLRMDLIDVRFSLKREDQRSDTADEIKEGGVYCLSSGSRQKKYFFGARPARPGILTSDCVYPLSSPSLLPLPTFYAKSD